MHRANSAGTRRRLSGQQGHDKSRPEQEQLPRRGPKGSGTAVGAMAVRAVEQWGSEGKTTAVRQRRCMKRDVLRAFVTL